jgi:hypothetical protein
VADESGWPGSGGGKSIFFSRPAGKGYDRVTGIGVPDVSKLIPALTLET